MKRLKARCEVRGFLSRRVLGYQRHRWSDTGTRMLDRGFRIHAEQRCVRCGMLRAVPL